MKSLLANELSEQKGDAMEPETQVLTCRAMIYTAIPLRQTAC